MRKYFLISILLISSLCYGAAFDDSTYQVATGETSSATKFNNTLAALKSSVNNIVTGQITNLTIQNEDIANSTINLTTKVTGVLPAANAAASVGTVGTSEIWTSDSNKDTTGARNLTITGSYIIGSASMDETDLEKLDGITNGTAAANKALVADANVDISGIRNLTFTGSMNTDISATEFSYLNGVTSAIQTQLSARATTAYQYTQTQEVAYTATVTYTHNLGYIPMHIVVGTASNDNPPPHTVSVSTTTIGVFNPSTTENVIVYAW